MCVCVCVSKVPLNKLADNTEFYFSLHSGLNPRLFLICDCFVKLLLLYLTAHDTVLKDYCIILKLFSFSIIFCFNTFNGNDSYACFSLEVLNRMKRKVGTVVGRLSNAASVLPSCLKFQSCLQLVDGAI